jgi:predicted ATPase
VSEFSLPNVGGFRLTGLSRINVILGKNGCGKSWLLKKVEQGLRGAAGFDQIRYVSPERGGILRYESGVEQNIEQHGNWLDDTRRSNQVSSFRAQSFTLFRRLEMAVLRGIERDHVREGYIPRTFDDTLDKLNLLLDRVRLVRDPAKTFRIVDRSSGEDVTPEAISSGETELISLGIEFLSFAKQATKDARNVIFVDEPDVHLHPDLQDRLARFIVELLATEPVAMVIATHSTPILAGLAQDPDTRVAFKRDGDTALNFKAVSDVDRTILPIFGAHPLSNVFNQAPVLLIEGEDDERIWQQAVRSANGRIRVYPCVVGSVDKFSDFEGEVNSLIEAVYENAKAFSLRDRDLHPGTIDDVGHLVRMRLACRAAENLMLTDDALALAGTGWDGLRVEIEAWAGGHPDHKYAGAMQEFINSGLDRKNHSLKDIRNILVSLMTNKPWEVLVGQAIAAVARGEGGNGEHSIRVYLGAKACEHLLGIEKVPEDLRSPPNSSFSKQSRAERTLRPAVPPTG